MAEEEHRAQLSGRMERHQGVAEAVPHLVEGLGREVLGVQRALVAELGEDLGLEVGPERVGEGGVSRQQRVRLHVHREAVGGALDPG